MGGSTGEGQYDILGGVMVVSGWSLGLGEGQICDPYCENVPKVAKTTIKIWLKVGNNFIFNKYQKPVFS